MKKLITLLCVFTCILSLTACKTSEETVNNNVDQATVQSYTENLYSQFLNTDEATMNTIIDSNNAYLSEDTEVALAVKRGMTAWIDAQDDLGAFVSVAGFDMEVEDDTVTGILHVNYEKHNMDFTVVFDEMLSKYTNIQINVDYSLGETMTSALLNTVMGMGIVFVVLIFMAFIISRFKYISKFEQYLSSRKDKKKAAKEQGFVPVSSDNAPVVLSDSQPVATDDLELVAVITAALAASLNTSEDNLVVRSIKKRKSNR